MGAMGINLEGLGNSLKQKSPAGCWQSFLGSGVYEGQFKGSHHRML
jgi:hypothetical protein